jgi:hypothetical protein
MIYLLKSNQMQMGGRAVKAAWPSDPIFADFSTVCHLTRERTRTAAMLSLNQTLAGWKACRRNDSSWSHFWERLAGAISLMCADYFGLLWNPDSDVWSNMQKDRPLERIEPLE